MKEREEEPPGAVEWRSGYGDHQKAIQDRTKGEGPEGCENMGRLIVDRTKHARITRKDATIKSRQAGSEVEG